ncbi:MAG: caspase family protein [Planctomycetes bacterium]|nr:caspase family protein [Planctomycetota bacterium]
MLSSYPVVSKAESRRLPVHLVATLVCAMLAGSCGGDSSVNPKPSEDATKSAKDQPTGRPSPFSGEGNRKHALLISIQNYPPIDGFGSLSGTHNDRQLMADTLVRRLGFPVENVHHLEDHEATASGILQAIDTKLVQKAPQGSEIVIYFAGHGSRCWDQAEVEDGGFDSSLIAYDSRAEGRLGSFDLSDDVLRAVLKHLCSIELGHHVTLITDCCHSAGASRGNARSRGGRESSYGSEPVALELWSDVPAWLEFEDDRPNEPRIAGYVHLAACSRTQEAFENELESFDGTKRAHGYFTWALTTVLERAQPNDSYGTLARRVRYATREVAHRDSYEQVPEFEGELSRHLFGSRFSPRNLRFDVERLEGDKLSLRAGTLHGIDQGCTIRVFAVGGNAIGRALVDRALLGSGRAHWIDMPEDLPDVALEAEVLDTGRPRELVLRCDKDELRSEIAAIDGLRLGDEKDERAYVVRAGEICTSEGVPLATLSDKDRATRAAELRSWQRRTRLWQRLWQLSEQPSAGELSGLFVSFEMPKEPERVFEDKSGAMINAVGFDADLPDDLPLRLPGLDQQKRDRQYRVSRLHIVNETLRPVYVHVLCLNERHEIAVIYPTNNVNDEALAADGEEDRHTRDVEVHLYSPTAAEWPVERPMRERYLVIAALNPIDLSPFTDAGQNDATTRGTPWPASLSGELGLGTRGPSARGGDQWGVGGVDILLSPVR